jgi:hypothetical protein
MFSSFWIFIRGFLLYLPKDLPNHARNDAGESSRSKHTNREKQEERAESGEQRPETREQRAETREQRAETREQRAKSGERRAESREQRAESREQRAESSVCTGNHLQQIDEFNTITQVLVQLVGLVW